MSKTGTHNYQAAMATSPITTTGNIDDLDFEGAGLLVMNNAALATIRGLKAKYAGFRLTIIAIGAGNVELAHQNANSAAANRLINFLTASNTVMTPGTAATYVYDIGTGRWRLASIILLDATQITSGTLADGRLSSNVALLDRDPQTWSGREVFTATKPIQLQRSGPHLQFEDSSQAADAKKGRIGLGNVTALTWSFSNLDDAESAEASVFDIGRATGLLTITGQIKYPASQNASANANTLDDYEEGSWTPVIGGSGGTSGQTYSLQVGRYIKIGRIVICFFAVQLSNKGTITTDVQISGLPFTITNSDSTFRSVAALNWFDLATSQLIIQAGCVENTTVMFIRALAAAAVTMGNTLATADINNDTAFSGTFLFLTDN